VVASRHGLKHHLPDFLELPCVKTGICMDCNNRWRICHFTSIIDGESAYRRGHINVVIIGERLGI
jgi:hypothetical protein